MELKNKHKRNVYNLAFAALFVGMVAAQIMSLWQYRPLINVTWVDIALLSIAVFRLTRLFVYDAVMGFFRELFLEVKVDHGKLVYSKEEYGPQRAMADIFSCPWCFSMWGGSVFVWLYLMYPPVMMYVAMLLTISAGATMLQLLANLLGWKAEHQKMVVEREQ